MTSVEPKRRQSLRRVINLSLGISTFLLLLLIMPASVAYAQSNNPSQESSATLSKLEDKFFDHNYQNEDEGTRVNRLEKFVFGDSQTGPTPDRIAKLQSVVEKNEVATSPPPQATSVPSVAPPEQFDQSSDTQPDNQDQGDQSQASAPAFDYSNYPRVTAIEQQLLGSTFVHDPIEARLSRLETKAFGKPSGTTDLCQRVDSLDQYAHKHDLFNESSNSVASGPVRSPSSVGQLVSAGGDSDDTAPVRGNPFAPGSEQVTGVAQRTAAMESIVFGRTYDNRPLEERVERLDKKLIPYEHDVSKKPLPTRVDELWSILSAANSSKNSPLSANPASVNDRDGSNNQANTGQSRQSQSWLHQMGKGLNSFGGMPGGGMMNPGYGPFPGTFWMP